MEDELWILLTVQGEVRGRWAMDITNSAGGSVWKMSYGYY